MLDLPFNHTVSIVIITVIISLIAFSNQNVMNRLIFWPPAMQKGQYDRFITHGFIHADGTHLLFNMITLFFFGSVIESFYRQYFYELGFVLFYLGGLIVAIIPSYLKHKNDHRWASLGASGAVSAVLFAYSQLYQSLQILDTADMFSVHDKFHRTLILSGFCFLKIAKISLNSSFFPKPIKR